MNENEKKEIEKKLFELGSVEKQIKILELKLEREKMAGCPRDISAVDFSKVGSGGKGTAPATTTLASVSKIIEKINNLKIEKEIFDNFKSIIQNESYEEYRFLVLYYCENKNILNCLDEMGYSLTSKSTIYKIKDSIIKKADKYVL